MGGSTARTRRGRAPAFIGPIVTLAGPTPPRPERGGRYLTAPYPRFGMTAHDPLLTELDRDQTSESGSLFLKLIADYLAESTSGEGPVSTRLTPEELAARFDEPMPAAGRPLLGG